jgi:hypothetical protein
VVFTADFHPTSNTIFIMSGYKFFSMVHRIEPWPKSNSRGPQSRDSCDY